MTISTLISAGTAPSSDRDVWAAPVAMRANWKNPITVRTGFETRIEMGLTASEQRRVLRGTPRRSISCSLTGTGRVETLAARQLLTRRSMAGYLMPLYSDQMETDAAASAAATAISVKTTDYRRCFAGDRVMVLHRVRGVVTSFEVHTVASVSSGTVNLDSAGLVADLPVESLLIPLLEAQLVDSYSNGFVLTDDKADFQNFTAQEIVGPTQIEGIATVGANPSGFDTFDSLPVFDGPIDYSQIRFGINRLGSFSDIGIGQLPVFFGDRGVQTISALLTCTTREEAWDFLRFFESRAGRAYPFYLRSPLEDYLVVGTNGNNLLVEDTGDLLDWNYRPYLVMELSDGTYDYREIDTVIQNGANHEISFVGAASLGTVVGARQLFKMRMFRDEIAERWLSTDRCQMTLEAVEVLEEKQVTMTETLSANGDSVVTEDGTLIGLGIAVADDSTTAVSPDLAMGGCDGSLIFECADCPSESTCDNCECTPEEMSLLLSGIVLCPACTEHTQSPFHEYTFTLSEDINVLHDLTQESECVWVKTIENGITTEKWDDDACSGEPLESTTVDLRIEVTKVNSTKWRVLIEAPTLVSSPATSLFLLFAGEITVASSDCEGFDSMPNELDATGCIDTYSDITTANVAATGGFASLTPCTAP